MVGRKVTLKGLSAKLWALGAATVRTTEFVQGRTSRWGLAWSFTSPPRAVKKNPVLNKSNHSFMLEVNYPILSMPFSLDFPFIYRSLLHFLFGTCPVSCFRTPSAIYTLWKMQLHSCNYSLVIAVSSVVPTTKTLSFLFSGPWSGIHCCRYAAGSSDTAAIAWCFVHRQSI